MKNKENVQRPCKFRVGLVAMLRQAIKHVQEVLGVRKVVLGVVDGSGVRPELGFYLPILLR